MTRGQSVVPRHVVILMSNYDATAVFKYPVIPMRGQSMRFSVGPPLKPLSRFSRCQVLLYPVPISQCTPLHNHAKRLSALIQSGSGARIIR